MVERLSSILKSLLNERVRNLINEHLQLWTKNCQLERLNGSNINSKQTRQEDPNHNIETIKVVYIANQLTGFYMSPAYMGRTLWN